VRRACAQRKGFAPPCRPRVLELADSPIGPRANENLRQGIAGGSGGLFMKRSVISPSTSAAKAAESLYMIE